MSFSVDTNGYFQPLNVPVIRDDRDILLPATRDYFETIVGVDGEYDFGCELEGFILNIKCLLNNITPTQWKLKRAEFAGYLNPKLGAQTLTFADEPGKVYMVRYAGRIEPTRHPMAREFVVPLKACDPFRISAFQSTLAASGNAINTGNIDVPFALEIRGAVTNPTVTVNGIPMTYTGTLSVNDVLTFDTQYMTAILNGANAISKCTSTFPKLAIGSNAVTMPSGGTATLTWYDRWI